MPSPPVFTIGEAATRAGVSADTLRYYERQGVLPRAHRTAAGYRVYSNEAMGRIQLVRNAVRFGFSVKAVAAFLRACGSGQAPCHAVRGEGARLLAEMDRRLAEMVAARDQISATIDQWDRRLAQAAPGSRARLLDVIPAPAAPGCAPIPSRRRARPARDW